MAKNGPKCKSMKKVLTPLIINELGLILAIFGPIGVKWMVESFDPATLIDSQLVRQDFRAGVKRSENFTLYRGQKILKQKNRPE